MLQGGVGVAGRGIGTSPERKGRAEVRGVTGAGPGAAVLRSVQHVVEDVFVHPVESYGFPGERRSEGLGMMDEESHYDIGILLDLFSWSGRGDTHNRSVLNST